MATVSEADVLLLLVIDVNWLVYAPFDPARDFRVDPPKVEQSAGETRKLHAILKDLTGSRYLLTPHSGTYCRTAYYQGEILEVYREAVEDGAEVAVHLHEEIKGARTRYAEDDHIAEVFAFCDSQLKSAGIAPTAYRGGHYAYTSFMNELLPRHNVYVDCSCAPGMNFPDRQAVWPSAPTTGYYLPSDPRSSEAGQPQTAVFEIPIGSDGLGANYENILHIEKSDEDNLHRIWRAVRDRSRDGRPEIVHALFHTGSVGEDVWTKRLQRFLDWVPRNGGAFVTAVQAKTAFDRLSAEVAI